MLDFHALRTTFGTRLAVNGVPQAMAQKLLRHSTSTLAAKYYAILRVEDKRQALAMLPTIEQGAKEGTQDTTQILRKSG